MKELIIIIASQDYEQANHKGLWEELSKNADTLIVNIPADYISSTLTRKTSRIIDAKLGVKKVSEKLSVFRPLLPLRLEIAPECLFPRIAKVFWKQIEAHYPDLSTRKINILVYDGRWIKALYGTRKALSFGYYLFDEVRNNANDGSKSVIRTKYDDYACSHASFILTMTEILAESRSGYTARKIVIGNGAEFPAKPMNQPCHISRSVAFIGNIRDWIDTELMTSLIQKKSDCLFAFVGPIEDNMKPVVDNWLNKFSNTAYFGKASKERMSEIYKMFDAVIIPYKQNEFIKATRPIKIVEAIFAGTPVVTVPVNGYQENEFIRFAIDADSFSRQLDKIMNNSVIEKNQETYNTFVAENTWKKKAEIISGAFNECGEII